MGAGTLKSRPSKSAPVDVLDWPRQLDGWQSLLSQCRRKPTRKRVHMLRVATLRLQAQMQFWLDNRGAGDSAAPIAKRWTKEAKHLRSALGAVRGFDVHLARLAQVRRLLIADSGYQPRTSRMTLRQIDDLETRVKDDRKNATKELKQTLATRHEQLEHTATELAAMPAVEPDLLQSLTTDRLSTMLLGAVAVFSRIDPESLHDFRKRLKSVRYLAECAAGNPDALQIAGTVKSMQSAIGEWHDWEELSIYARRMLRRKDAPELTGELEILMKESLDKALATCARITEEILLGSRSAQMPAKKPVRREDRLSARRETVLA